MSGADACLAGCCSPFTNCCIGLRNERFFVLWLAGVWAGCLYGATVSWPPFRLCIVQGMMRGVDTLASSDIARCVAIDTRSQINKDGSSQAPDIMPVMVDDPELARSPVAQIAVLPVT